MILQHLTKRYLETYQALKDARVGHSCSITGGDALVGLTLDLLKEADRREARDERNGKYWVNFQSPSTSPEAVTELLLEALAWASQQDQAKFMHHIRAMAKASYADGTRRDAKHSAKVILDRLREQLKSPITDKATSPDKIESVLVGKDTPKQEKAFEYQDKDSEAWTTASVVGSIGTQIWPAQLKQQHQAECANDRLKKNDELFQQYRVQEGMAIRRMQMAEDARFLATVDKMIAGEPEVGTFKADYAPTVPGNVPSVPVQFEDKLDPRPWSSGFAPSLTSASVTSSIGCVPVNSQYCNTNG